MPEPFNCSRQDASTATYPFFQVHGFLEITCVDRLKIYVLCYDHNKNHYFKNDPQPLCPYDSMNIKKNHGIFFHFYFSDKICFISPESMTIRRDSEDYLTTFYWLAFSASY